MARTISEIQASIIKKYIAERLAAGYVVEESTWSITDLRLLWSYIVAFAIATLENLFDVFKKDVEQIIADKDPYHPSWWVAKAKAFQYGYNLVPDTDYYNNTGLTLAQIEASKVITHAAVEELTRGVRIKAARTVGEDLAEMTAPQKVAALAYLQRIKPFGCTPIIFTSSVADALKIKLLVKFNPLVLNSLGQRLDGTNNTPVQATIKTYLKNLPFNGQLELMKLVDVIQEIEGVEAAYVVEASARYGVLPYTGFSNYKYVPDAGYVRFYSDADLQIDWLINA